MAEWLLVGDPHAVVDELDDCERLIDGVVETILAERPRYVVFLGDQHHNHALMHVEVMAFWRRAFQRVTVALKTAGGETVAALVGNHDMPGDGASSSHAMMAYEDIPGLKVIATPTVIDGVLLLPYRHQPAQFLGDLAAHPQASTVICHQTFDGSRYENGFYAKDGVKVEEFGDRFFISGHIHTPQGWQNIVYVGAPRWRTLSDVGVERALVKVTIEPGREKRWKLFHTDKWCQKLVHLEDRQEAPLDWVLRPNWKYIVDIYGSQSFIQERKKVWTGCRIRTFKTQEASSRVSESMGILNALQEFLRDYKPRFGTPPEVLRGMVAQRIG